MSMTEVHVVHDGHGVSATPLANIGKAVPANWFFHECSDHDNCFRYAPLPTQETAR